MAGGSGEQERDTVRYERGDDGIVTLVLDDPAQSQNTMNTAYARSMGAAVARLEAERDGAEGLTGVIVTSAKSTFFAGGDLHQMVKAGPGDAQQLTTLLVTIKGDLRRLERLGRPVVAALNGSALGGGLEIALACHHRVALDSPKSRFGFPEVTLGLLPGAGGVSRTVRMLGIADALTKVLLEGRQYRPAQAKDVGLVDEVVGTPEAMIEAARAWIAAHQSAQQPWDVKGYRIPGGTPSTASFAANLPAFPATLRKRLKGAPLPAPKAILAAAVEGAQVDVDTALTVETRYLVDLLTGPVSTNMIKAFFFDLGAANAGATRPQGYPTFTARRVAVLGAGMMGAGIAYACARAGMDVVLKDVALDAATRGKAYSQKLLDREVAKGRMAREAADAVLARILPTADAADAAGCDLVIEAVFEDPQLKQRVYAEIEPVLAPDALLATNTSSLPVSSLAGAVTRPDDFVGLHFFSPVEKMPLVEIVVGERTSDATLARAVDVVRQLRKTPIVVRDSRGFFTSRVIGRFLDEAVAMLAEGVHPQTVEQAALQAGYPTGPLALLDEVSLSLAQRIRRAGRAAAEAEGRPWVTHPAESVIDRMVDEFRRPGRAGRAGFYEYGPDGARLGLWPGLVEHVVDPGGQRWGGRLPRSEAEATNGIRFEELKERFLFVEALDAVRCLEEGVLRSTAEGNVGSILGIGYPAWTGGALQYVEQYTRNGGDGFTGPAAFVARAQELAQRYGDRFTPPASLLTRLTT